MFAFLRHFFLRTNFGLLEKPELFGFRKLFSSSFSVIRKQHLLSISYGVYVKYVQMLIAALLLDILVSLTHT